MQAELDSNVALSSANALLAHLRRHPDAVTEPPRDLAAQFGLEEAFVTQVLQNVSVSRRPESRPIGARRSVVGAGARRVRGVWMGLTSRPFVFVVVTFVLSFLAIAGLSMVSPGPRHLRDGSALTIATGMAIVGVILGTLLLHMAVYFRHRSTRNAVHGGLALWAFLAVPVGIALLSGRAKIQGPDAPPVFVFLMAITVLMLAALIYTGLGALAAVLGGWTRFKLQEREEETMSRQELLERYFELQSRLQSSVYPRSAGQASPFFETGIIALYRRFQWASNLVIGFALSACELIGTEASGIGPAGRAAEVNVWIFVVMFLSIVKFLFYIFQGYLSRSAWLAILGAACVAVGSSLAQLMPLSEIARNAIGGIGTPGYLLSALIDMAVMSAVACAGYLGAVVQNRAAREANLQQNDQATLLAEMVRIQWRLSNEASAICVMVVDAAKSSEMKADADPLAVEYTFREYQDWIEAIGAERGGRVHSTAGDGAVVAFTTCALALSAARRLQTDVFQFNKDVNRLSRPFRLRIGLHMGEVAGDINQVQFTEVIDIAAHIEGACPIGGIAVTDVVVSRLPEDAFIDLGIQVDGHQVFMAADPTDYR